MRANVLRWLVSGSAAALLAVAPAQAQSLTGATGTNESAAIAAPRAAASAAATLRPTASPLLARDAATPRTPRDATAAETEVAQRLHEGTDFALMVVGGALFVAGAIMSGDTGTVFMVGGALIGAYGLYQYLK